MPPAVDHSGPGERSHPRPWWTGQGPRGSLVAGVVAERRPVDLRRAQRGGSISVHAAHRCRDDTQGLHRLLRSIGRAAGAERRGHLPMWPVPIPSRYARRHLADDSRSNLLSGEFRDCWMRSLRSCGCWPSRCVRCPPNRFWRRSARQRRRGIIRTSRSGWVSRRLSHCTVRMNLSSAAAIWRTSLDCPCRPIWRNRPCSGPRRCNDMHDLDGAPRSDGLLGPRFSGAHAIWIDDAEVELIARQGGTLAHTPGPTCG